MMYASIYACAHVRNRIQTMTKSYQLQQEKKKKLVVLLFELPVENSKHLNFNLNGGEARWGVDCFALKLPYLSTMSQ